MAWKELNLAEAKLNMSKSSPYTPDLNMLDQKVGFWHNNRLTAINKWTTNSAVGYKCYKRKANANNLVDGELTDYIEINKIDESGSITHMLDVADKYYKCETESYSGTANLPDFHRGVILDNTLIGTVDTWSGYEFIILGEHLYLAFNANNNEKKYIYTRQTTSSTYSSNFISTTVQVDNNAYIFVTDNYVYISTDDTTEDFADYLKTYQTNYYSDTDVTASLPFIRLNRKTYEYTEVNCVFTRTTVLTGVSYRKTKFVRDTYGSVVLDDKYTLYSDSFTNENTMVVDEKYSYWEDITGEATSSLVLTYGLPEGTTKSYSQTLTDSAYWEAYDPIENGEVTNYDDIHAYQKVYFALTQGSFSSSGIASSDISTGVTARWDYKVDWNNTSPVGISGQVMWIYHEVELTDVYDGTDITSIDYNITSSNYINDSVFINNGMVVNYTNRVAVTLGHKYKTIARLDTQGASYLGSDATYAYVKQNSVYYKISIADMYPSVDYDEEVNIIENTVFCKQVNGYKIFNTTTYYNAIYNDDPTRVICSCDDWNGRYTSTSVGMEDATLLNTSRVGHFWNATSSWDDIPNTAISDELNDFYELPDPTYSWVNEDYTIHEGTTAYIYGQNDNQVDTKYQQYSVTSDGFAKDYTETKIFVHNSPYQLVPSILFTDYLKSDVVNMVQIGSEMYSLLTYAYSETVPALVYQSTAEALNIDPTSEEMVIQGAYYTISGATSNRKITNPYDTSSRTYCCDVTGLKYIGYDSSKAYFYSPAIGRIYTFSGDNKLDAYLEIDKRVPLSSADKDGIEVCNIPSINLTAMAFTDGVLVILSDQVLFIPQQSVGTLSANKEYGILKINGSYYYFGTNTTVKSLIAATGGKTVITVTTLPDLSALPEAETDETSSLYNYSNRLYYIASEDKYYAVLRTTVTEDEAVSYTYSWRTVSTSELTGSSGIVETNIKTCKLGQDRTTNITATKHRVCLYSEETEATEITLTFVTKLGNEVFTDVYTKKIPASSYINNEYMFELTPRHTKGNWQTIEIDIKNADILNYYVDVSDKVEEYMAAKV